MDKNHPLIKSLDQLSHDLRLFIELSLREPDDSWEEWWNLTIKDGDVKCWEKKGCTKQDCPAYLNPGGRCWLIAGTMCRSKVQGEFALKYKSCMECDVYQEAVSKDPVTEAYEHIITLVHSLRLTQDKLKTMAVKDVLTDVYNRNYFNEIIKKEMERSKRHGSKLSIAMIDIDNFKEINDKYGHLHGDGILRECASILNKSIRGSDILVRFGGDEFLIVMTDTDCKENDALIDRIKLNLSEWNNEFASSDYSLSFSMGCAVFEDGREILDVIKEADDNMYKNKLENKRQ